jgi:hypothetical protein
MIVFFDVGEYLTFMANVRMIDVPKFKVKFLDPLCLFIFNYNYPLCNTENGNTSNIFLFKKILSVL